MNANLILLTLCQGLFFTNNVTFIAINGLVGLSMAPLGWMATLPVMGYVVGGALSTGLVAKSQSHWGRKVSFQLGLVVAFFSTLLAAYAAWSHNFWLLVAATVIAGYYSANGQLYRFAAAELAADGFKEKAISLRQPVFIVAAAAAALSYGVMNLLMAATPLAMQVCGFSFDDAALVLEWHVIGMFAPGFFTGHLIKKFGTLQIMAVGVVINFVCIAIALSGIELHQFLISLFLLGLGWNFLFTGSTTLAMQAWTPAEKDRGQAAINFFVFATMAVTSFASGALVTTQGWMWLNIGSILPVALTGAALVWMVLKQRDAQKSAPATSA
jgi:MFS family permease